MSAERKEWDREELELLQHVKAQNATAKIEYLTRLFNEKNGRKRTLHAIRFRLKILGKLARDSVVERLGPPRGGTEPRGGTNTRDSTRNKILLPSHPLINSRQPRDATWICGCDKLSTRHQSNLQLAFTSRSSPRDDALDWDLKLPTELRKIVIK